MKNKYAYLCIILGTIIALSRFVFKEYDQFLLIGGMVLLMLGIYNISKKLSSKEEKDYTPPLVITEEDKNDDSTQKDNEKS